MDLPCDNFRMLLAFSIASPEFSSTAAAATGVSEVLVFNARPTRPFRFRVGCDDPPVWEKVGVGTAEVDRRTSWSDLDF